MRKLSLILILFCFGLALIAQTSSCEPPDRDEDGIADPQDNCPDDANPFQTDADGDRVGDECDNCIDDTNREQTDTDNDGFGDVCDNCASKSNPSQKDCDEDGVGDDCDDDTDKCYINCGGYNYPIKTIVEDSTCTGWFNGCTGNREFLVVGCYTSNPSSTACPSGYSVATLMMIGQWAEAADITRYVSGTSVCMYSGGSSATTACGGTHTTPYCWPRGADCLSSCPSNCCPSSGPCSSSGYQAPLLCVKN